MYIDAFLEILQRECANCTKHFRDPNPTNRNEIEWSTTLVLSNLEFISPLEDITNFQAISYIYGVPPIRLEDSIRKHLTTTKKQNPNEVSTSEPNEKENATSDPLSSFNLPLCQTCSATLAQLYTAFYNFEKLSNKKSIISKGIQNSKVNNFEDIKLENLSEIVCKIPNNFDCLEQRNENSNKIVEQLDELNSVKEEMEDSVLEISINSSNTSKGEENSDAEEIEKATDLEIEQKNTSSCGMVTRRSTRLARKNDKHNESLTPNDGFKEKPTEDYNASSNEHSASEESDRSTGDESDNRKANAVKRKIKSSKTKRRSKISKRAEKNRQTSVTSPLDIKDRRYKSKVLGLHSLRCILCKVYLSSARTFKRHHQIRHNIILKDNSSLEKWMDICTSKCYNCDICDEFFISNQELNLHLISHCKYQDTATECNEVICGSPFLCPKCENSDKQYENGTLLQLHGLKTHQVAFKSQQSLELGKDTTSKTSFCNECDIAFEQNKYWAEHMKKLHHVCGCYICYKTFPDENLLHVHIKTKHLLPKSRGCPICDQEFPNLRCLWMHTLVHVAEGDENLELQIFEEFATPFLLKGSELQDEMDKDKSALDGDYYVNHHCFKCSKGFKSFYAMKIHQAAQSIVDFDKLSREDINGRDFHCPICDIDCKRNIILREHCLSKHQMIVSTKTYRAEEFLKELLEEKEDCKGLTIPESKPLNKKKVCKHCCKFFISYYHKKFHEIVYTKDISTMERQIVEKVDGNCPRCEISFNNTVQQSNAYLQFKVHCLNKHDLIISTNATKLEAFKQWLINEKEYCKNQTGERNANDDNIIANQIETSSEPAAGSNPEEKLCLKENKDYNPNLERNCIMMSRSKARNEQKLCYRCGKNCISHYAKKYHELSHKLDINSLEKEKLKGEKCHCPRCEIHFADSGIGLYKLKLHCLEEHKLIIARSSVDLKKFFEFLQNEKEHCNKNKKIESTLCSEKNDVGIAIAVQEIKKSSKDTTKKYACRFCGKVYKRSMKKIHELAHQIDLTKVEMENSHGTSGSICLRCGRTFKSALHLRLHCLENHNLIVSTSKYSGETFLNLLREEQELMNRTQKDDPALNSGSQTVPNEKAPQKIQNRDIPKQNSDLNAGGDSGSVIQDTAEAVSQKFVCDVCGKVTQDHVALFGHKVSHQTEKKFICERCGASFKTANLFRSHMRVHFEKDNGIRPSCNICGKDFISSRNLFRHKTYYHPKKKRSCPVCNKTFASNRYAAQHIKKHTAAMK